VNRISEKDELSEEASESEASGESEEENDSDDDLTYEARNNAFASYTRNVDSLYWYNNLNGYSVEGGFTLYKGNENSLLSHSIIENFRRDSGLRRQNRITGGDLDITNQFNANLNQDSESLSSIHTESYQPVLKVDGIIYSNAHFTLVEPCYTAKNTKVNICKYCTTNQFLYVIFEEKIENKHELEHSDNLLLCLYVFDIYSVGVFSCVCKCEPFRFNFVYLEN
jgi:hypothetical protein